MMDFFNLIENLPAVLQAIVVSVVFATITVGGLYLVRRRVEPESLRLDHDVAGFTFGVIGAFYGVILAFVIVVVWQRFERANEQVQDESLAVSNLYNLAAGLGEPMRTDMQNVLRAYTNHVLNDEWKAMADYRYSPNPAETERIWNVLLRIKPTTIEQQVFLDKSVDQMTQLSDLRRLRFVYYSEDLPSVIWIVIYAGCVITLGFSYFFVTRRFRQQAIMYGTFAALIGLTILAISELATPYQGAVVVSNQAFKILAASINRMPDPSSPTGSMKSLP
jgi:Protein of unknown function (DUF4239)